MEGVVSTGDRRAAVRSSGAGHPRSSYLSARGSATNVGGGAWTEAGSDLLIGASRSDDRVRRGVWLGRTQMRWPCVTL